jgi:hypothetical protein
LDYLLDLDADFLRFYGLDIYEMDSVRALTLAWRVPMYEGVVLARLRKETEGTGKKSTERPAASNVLIQPDQGPSGNFPAVIEYHAANPNEKR